MLQKMWAVVVSGILMLSTLLISSVADAPASNQNAAANLANALSTQTAAPVAVATPAEPAPAVEPAVEETAQAVETVTLDAAQRASLAKELASWVTRHPRELVTVVADIAEREPLPVSPTLVLSIAWAETRGKILAVSPAGAAGLAQATPAAYMLEGFDGKIYVTTDYLMGTRAYIMKKPLADAMAIASPLIERNTPARRARAKKLLEEAIELRREGMDELEALYPVANDVFVRKITEADAYNLAALNDLGRLIDRGAPRAEMKRFHTRMQKDYRYLRNVQRRGWETYAKQLETRRDALLRKRFGASPATVIKTRPYEAGEYLGEALDARFSPTKMTRFLAAHLATKQRQAIALGVPADELEAWTAALYNGGAVNVKRMRAGLLSSLRETQNYMAKVPSRRAKLDTAMGG